MNVTLYYGNCTNKLTGVENVEKLVNWYKGKGKQWYQLNSPDSVTIIRRDKILFIEVKDTSH